MKKTYKKGKLELALDKSQVFPDDPGQGTPAMVFFYGPNYTASATYWCATGEGELTWDKGVYRLSDRQLNWLESLDAELTEFLYK